MPVRLTPHFTRAEFEVGSRGGPVPRRSLAEYALGCLCASVLEPLRMELDAPLEVSSGYRPRDPGQHGKGEAADLKFSHAPDLRVRAFVQLYRWACEGHRIDQLIVYTDSAHLHISHTTRRPNRSQVYVAYPKAEGGHRYEDAAPGALRDAGLGG